MATPATEARPEPLLRQFEPTLIGGAMVLLFLVFWEGFSRGFWADLLQPLLGEAAGVLRIRPIFISSPTRVLLALGRMVESGELWEHLRASGAAFTLGGGLAVLVGIPLGMAAGWYRRLNYAVEPFLVALNATPQVVFIPLIIIWVGTGLFAKVLIIAMITVIPLAMNAMAAVKTTDPRLLKVAASFGSAEWRRFRDIILPGSVPFLLAGLRLGVGRGMVGIVVGEIYASTAGIGYLINVAGASFQTDRVFVGILVIAVVGLLLTGAIHVVERRVEIWRPKAVET